MFVSKNTVTREEGKGGERGRSEDWDQVSLKYIL